MEEGSWAACCSNPGWTRRSNSYNKDAKMWTLRGAKEKIVVPCGFLVLPFTGIEEKGEGKTDSEGSGGL